MNRLWNRALLLAAISVCYNILEGLVSVYFGYTDETLSLFGFGLDSFVELISGVGVWHMIIRVRNNNNQKDSFEKTALRITGVSFYTLTFGLFVTAIYNIYSNSKPITTVWGIIISLLSVLTMIFLTRAKLSIGKKLNSNAIIADANCTKTCVYLSIVLLLSSVLYEIFRIGYIDSIGALGIAYYAFKEGRESLEKSKGKVCTCCE
ncbi:MAG: cation transporter [Thermodesulfobacteriota bacterium]